MKPVKITKHRYAFMLAAFMGASSISTPADASDVKVEHKPVSIWGMQELGRIQSGVAAEQDSILEREWVDHFGAALSKQAVINDRLFLNIGIGGVFQFLKPEVIQPTFVSGQRKLLYIGPSVAEAVYKFGDVEKPWLQLGTGIFNYKYNPDAHNLGEYLFRATPYPTTLSTGGLTVINSSGVQLQGFKGLLAYGPFSLDLLFTTETTFPPFYDWSLAAVGTAKLAGGLLEVGAGVNFKRILPIHPDTTSPKVVRNAYFRGDFGSGPELFSGDLDYYKSRKEFYEGVADSSTLDPAIRAAAQNTADSLSIIQAQLDDWRFREGEGEGPAILDSLNAEFYTNQGIILMGRLALDPKKLWDENELLGKEDLKMYMEVALLGWRDYPIFYEDKTQRMPVMFGVNLPAWHTFKNEPRWLQVLHLIGFGVLPTLADQVSIQVEYFNSPWLNNHFSVGRGNVATPFFSSSEIYSQDGFFSVAEEDNYYWSILLHKEVVPGFRISAQAGRDHYRVIAPEFLYGLGQDPNETFFRSQDWYWMLQFSWGL